MSSQERTVREQRMAGGYGKRSDSKPRDDKDSLLSAPAELENAEQRTPWSPLILFLCCIPHYITIDFVANLSITSLLGFVLAPAFLVKRGTRLLRSQYVGTFVVFCGVWLVGILLSDVLNNVLFYWTFRSISTISAVTSWFIVCYLLMENTRSGVWYASVFMTMSMPIGFIVSPTENFSGQVWLYAGGAQAALVVIALYGLGSIRRGVCVVALIGLGFANFYGESRFPGGQCFALAFVLLLGEAWSARVARLPTAHLRYAMTGLALLGGMVGFYFVATAAMQSGVLGEAAKAKFEHQGRGQYGLLVGGRPDPFIGVQAVRDRPILGFGSTAYGPTYARMMATLERYGYKGMYSTESRNETIPTHSMIIEWWVKAGIAGAALWGWLFWIAGKAILRGLIFHDRVGVLAIYLGTSLVFDILFSLGPNKTYHPFVCAVLFLYLTSPNALAFSPRKRQSSGTFGRGAMTSPVPKH